MDSTDSEIISRVRAGDTASFESLVLKYQGRVFATARRYARRESEVEDIVQEVFLKAFQKLGGFRGEAPFEHWLMRLAVRTCYDFLRRHQRNRETTISELGLEDTSWLDSVAASNEAAPSEEWGGSGRELLERLLNQLPPADRLVITLLELEERPVREIAGLTGWSETLVKVRAFRARAKLRKALEKLLKQNKA